MSIIIYRLLSNFKREMLLRILYFIRRRGIFISLFYLLKTTKKQTFEILNNRLARFDIKTKTAQDGFRNSKMQMSCKRSRSLER